MFLSIVCWPELTPGVRENREKVTKIPKKEEDDTFIFLDKRSLRFNLRSKSQMDLKSVEVWMVLNLFKAFLAVLLGCWKCRWRRIALGGGGKKFEVVGFSLCGGCGAPKGSRDTSCQGRRLAFHLAALFMRGWGFEESPSNGWGVGALRVHRRAAVDDRNVSSIARVRQSLCEKPTPGYYWG